MKLMETVGAEKASTRHIGTKLKQQEPNRERGDRERRGEGDRKRKREEREREREREREKGSGGKGRRRQGAEQAGASDTSFPLRSGGGWRVRT